MPVRATIVLFLIAVIAFFGWKHRELLISILEPASQSPSTHKNSVDSTSTSQGTTTTNDVTPEVSQQASETSSETLQREAETFVETLTQSDPEPIEIEQADHFVDAKQALALLPEANIETGNIEEILNDGTLSPTTPITVVKEIEQIETVSPEKLIAESGGDLDKPIVVLENNTEVQTTVRKVLEAHSKKPEVPISIVKKVRYFEITTPAELLANLDTTVQGEELLGIIKKPYQLESASISELLTKENLDDPDSVFYVRTVKPSDHQGIWGIVQGGVISNFARGVAVRRGQEVNTYQVDIPPLADEMLDDTHSSFLGQLIYEKSRESYVYNFKDNRMGRNPDDISPGQEIVIIRFSADELIGIYKHFVGEAG